MTKFLSPSHLVRFTGNGRSRLPRGPERLEPRVCLSASFGGDSVEQPGSELSPLGFSLDDLAALEAQIVAADSSLRVPVPETLNWHDPQDLHQGAAPTADLLPEEALVEYAVHLTDMEGNKVEEVTAGQEFQVHVSARDLRNPEQARGVFAAYIGLHMQGLELELTEQVAIGESFPNVQVYESAASASGFSRIGGITELFPSNNDGDALLLNFRARASEPGITTISTHRALGNDPANETLLFDLNRAVPVEAIQFGSASLIVSRPSETNLGSNTDLRPIESSPLSPQQPGITGQPPQIIGVNPKTLRLLEVPELEFANALVAVNRQERPSRNDQTVIDLAAKELGEAGEVYTPDDPVIEHSARLLESQSVEATFDGLSSLRSSGTQPAQSSFGIPRLGRPSSIASLVDQLLVQLVEDTGARDANSVRVRSTSQFARADMVQLSTYRPSLHHPPESHELTKRDRSDGRVQFTENGLAWGIVLAQDANATVRPVADVPHESGEALGVSEFARPSLYALAVHPVAKKRSQVVSSTESVAEATDSVPIDSPSAFLTIANALPQLVTVPIASLLAAQGLWLWKRRNSRREVRAEATSLVVRGPRSNRKKIAETSSEFSE